MEEDAKKWFAVQPTGEAKNVISKKMGRSTSAFSPRTESMGFSVRVPQRAGKPFLEADAEKFLLSRGFRPATQEKSRTIREVVARTDAKIARQLAGV